AAARGGIVTGFGGQSQATDFRRRDRTGTRRRAVQDGSRVRDLAGSRAVPRRRGMRDPGLPLRPGDPSVIGRDGGEGRLGPGGMGPVFLASAPEGRLVAVKVIRADLAADSEFRARFAGEVS